MTPDWKARLDSFRLAKLDDLFRVPKPVLGMVHCWPMPGAPGYAGGGLDPIVDAARRDAEALIAGGVDGLIVENMWDVPFRAGPKIAPESVASHAVVWPASATHEQKVAATAALEARGILIRQSA